MDNKKWIFGLLLLFSICIPPIQGSYTGKSLPTGSTPLARENTTATPQVVDKPPEVNITYPENESTVNPPFRVAWEAFDANGIDESMVSLNGEIVRTIEAEPGEKRIATSAFFFSSNLTFKEGWNNITITVKDRWTPSRVTEKTARLNVSLTDPGVLITHPPWKHILSERRFNLTWNVRDPERRIDHFELFVDGEPNDTQISNSARKRTVSYTKALGSFTVTLKAYGEGDVLFDSDSLALFFDDTPPQVHILTPEDGAKYKESFVARWNGSDEGTGIETYRVFLDGRIYDEIGREELRIVTYEEGNHTLKVVAVDVAENTGTSQNVTFIHDTQPPLILPTVEGGAYQNATIISEEGRITVKWFIYDASTEVDTQMIRLDNESWIPLSPDTSEHTFEGVEGGKHTVRLKANDTLGNTVSIVAHVTVEETGWDQPLWMGIIVGEVIGIVAGIGGIILIKKRRRG